MAELLITLTPISLLDSLSLLPFAVVVLSMLFRAPRPYAGVVAFLSGLFASYFASGVLIAVGLGGIIERVTTAVVYWFWHPSAIDYILSIVVGIALIVSVMKWSRC